MQNEGPLKKLDIAPVYESNNREVAELVLLYLMKDL